MLLNIVLAFSVGALMYLARLLLLHLRTEKEKEINHPTLLVGASAISLGVASLLWGMLITDIVPTRLWDPAFVLAILCMISGFLTMLFMGMVLLTEGYRKGFWHRVKWHDKILILVFPAILLSCFAAFPLLTVPEGTLVVLDGRILPFGSNYQIRPFMVPRIVGLDDPVLVIAVKPVDKVRYGASEIIFESKINLALKPGDAIPADFNWEAFRWQLSKWFGEKLGNRFDAEPRWKHGTFLSIPVSQPDNERRLDKPESGIVMGIPVAWNGVYTFPQD